MFKRNNLHRYKSIPDSGISNSKYVDDNQMCYAEFCAYYLKVYIGNTNGSQLVILGDHKLERNK